MYSHFISYLGFHWTEDNQIHNGATLHVAYTVNTMPADALVTLGAKASGGMVLTPKARILCLQHQKS